MTEYGNWYWSEIHEPVDNSHVHISGLPAQLDCWTQFKFSVHVLCLIRTLCATGECQQACQSVKQQGSSTVT